MIRLRFLKRPPQILSIASLGAKTTTRCHLVSGPKITPPTLPYNPLFTRSSQLPVLSHSFTLKRSIHTVPERTESESENSVWRYQYPKIYRNKYGEEMVLNGKYLPREYTFVPSGNLIITRDCRKECRKLGHKIFVKYRPQSRKNLTKHLGLYVPKSVFKIVKSEFETEREAVDADSWRKFDEEYPYIPSAERSKLYAITSAERSLYFGDTLKYTGIDVYSYVQNEHIPFRTLDRQECDKQVRKILASWRGEDQTSDSESMERSEDQSGFL